MEGLNQDNAVLTQHDLLIFDCQQRSKPCVVVFWSVQARLQSRISK